MGIESPVHLLFIAIVALLVLGPKRLPDMAKALGQGIREFRGSLEDGASGASEQPLAPPPPPPPAPAAEAVPPANTTATAHEPEPSQPQTQGASETQAPAD